MSSVAPSIYAQIPVLESHIAYREEGGSPGPAVVFLHGNPTSSHIWRNILPHVAPVARCLAPDLIGFGRSGRPDIAYRFADHVRYLDGFLEAMDLGPAFFVAQDWGTALAFHLAARRPEAVRGLAFMEFIRPTPTWEDFHPNPATRGLFQALRTPGKGEALIREDNVFIEKVLPGSILRALTREEMEGYRAPFADPASRTPMWRLPNELPIAGEPADVWAWMTEAHEALARAAYPKLLFSADPGVLTPPSLAEATAARLPHCRLVRLGRGAHYLQEDHATRIGRELAAWITECLETRDASLAETRP